MSASIFLSDRRSCINARVSERKHATVSPVLFSVSRGIAPACSPTRALINNYWMRLTMISRIIQTEVNVICRSRRLRRITLTEVWIILDIMRKPNPIIVLLYIQNSDRCKKRFAVKRLVRLTFQIAAGHVCCFVVVTSSASNNIFGQLR